MKIAVSGANGFIGRNLVRRLQKESHEIVILNRNLLYNETDLEEEISGSEVVIHLAGAPIFQRWTQKSKAVIMNSRTMTTQNLVKAINQLPDSKRPELFISASAVGIYRTNENHTEKSISYANDFVGEVAQNWEKNSEELDNSVRRVVFRIGIVLGSEAKIIRQLVPLFKLGLGGKIGSGKQAFPFVHIFDVVEAFRWSITKKKVCGIYNLVAPQQITNKDFTKAFAKLLKRPVLFAVPSFLLKLIFGEASTLFLQNPAVYPERLTDSGFQFRYPDIQSCLSESIKKPH